MLAFVVLCALLVEALLYGAIGVALADRYAWPAWTGAIFVAAGIALSRLALVLYQFAMARPYAASPAPGAMQWLRIVLAEWRAMVVLYTLLQPLEAFINRRDARASARGVPVVLVHGLACNGAVWSRFKRALARRGLGACYTLNLEPVAGDIDGYAKQLVARVESVCARRGVDKVMLVGHSMGGLVARAYLQKLGGARRVLGLVTLGTPHHGSALASEGRMPNVTQMAIGNPWLTDLNRSEREPAPATIVSIYSLHDNLVKPQRSSRLAHAENIEMNGIGHLSLLYSDVVVDRVAQAIAQAIERSRA